MFPRCYFMFVTLQNTVQCILKAKKAAWIALIRSLQACCVFLIITIVYLLLCRKLGDLRYLRLAYIFRDYSQLSLLLGALIPPCLQELA